jgi:hypothetical protein
LAKNQYTQRKPLYFEYTGSASSSKLGMILENQVVQKLKLEKNVSYKKWSPKLIFLNEFFFEKTPLIFDIEN